MPGCPTVQRRRARAKAVAAPAPPAAPPAPPEPPDNGMLEAVAWVRRIVLGLSPAEMAVWRLTRPAPAWAAEAWGERLRRHEAVLREERRGPTGGKLDWAAVNQARRRAEERRVVRVARRRALRAAAERASAN